MRCIRCQLLSPKVYHILIDKYRLMCSHKLYKRFLNLSLQTPLCFALYKEPKRFSQMERRGSIVIIPLLIKNMPYLYHALILVLKSQGHCNLIFNYCIYSKNYLFPVLEYFLVQFIEGNVKFIIGETELRRVDNTTSAMYLD